MALDSGFAQGGWRLEITVFVAEVGLPGGVDGFWVGSPLGVHLVNVVGIGSVEEVIVAETTLGSAQEGGSVVLDGKSVGLVHDGARKGQEVFG